MNGRLDGRRLGALMQLPSGAGHLLCENTGTLQTSLTGNTGTLQTSFIWNKGTLQTSLTGNTGTLQT